MTLEEAIKQNYDFNFDYDVERELDVLPKVQRSKEYAVNSSNSTPVYSPEFENGVKGIDMY